MRFGRRRGGGRGKERKKKEGRRGVKGQVCNGKNRKEGCEKMDHKKRKSV